MKKRYIIYLSNLLGCKYIQTGPSNGLAKKMDIEYTWIL